MRDIVSFSRNIFLGKVYHRVKYIVIVLQHTTPATTSEASGSTTNGFVKFGSFTKPLTGEENNTDLSC